MNNDPSVHLLQQIETIEYEAAGVSVGMRVGAQRWPYSHSHADAWLPPLQGTVLSRLDVRAWQKTMRFDNPTQAQVAEHVAWCYRQGLLHDCAPVLYSGGEGGSEPFIVWDRLAREAGVCNIAPAHIDMERWVLARASARAAEQVRQPAKHRAEACHAD